jgi:hypothetical protein
MAPFKVLYGRKCRTPLNWIEPGEKAIFGPDIVDEAEATVHRIQENLKVAKLREESYANKRRRPCILKGFTNEGCEEIWSETKAVTSLYWTILNS